MTPTFTAFIALAHFGAAGFVSEMAYDAWNGRFDPTPKTWALLAVAIVVNIVMLVVFFRQWHRRHKTEAIDPSVDLKRIVGVAVHGLPVNLRIRLLLNAVAWITGIIVPIVFAIE